MGLRDKFEDKIKKKKEEIEQLHIKIREAEAYIQGLQDAMKYLPKYKVDVTSDKSLRPGSMLHKTYTLLKSTGKPMHINDILQGIGLQVDRDKKVSLTGSLGSYVRNKQIFTRPAPNTFGLISMENEDIDEPPDDFGFTDEESEENDEMERKM